MAKDKNKPTEKPAINDPLEGAKLFQAPPEPPQVPAGPPVPTFAPSGEVEEEHAPKPVYRVLKTTTVSIDGSLVKLNENDVISEALYGAKGYEQIKVSNVPLVEIE